AVYTMGPGEHVFERFGHAAICVEHPVNAGRAPADRCYNYGTTDFQTPPQQIGWDFVRGKAKFWVSVWPRERMLQAYIAADRDVYRQVLVLSPSEQAQLERRLVHDSQEANRYYRYHHFDDNCTTRIRDVVDEAVAGRLLSHGKTDVGVT